MTLVGFVVVDINIMKKVLFAFTTFSLVAGAYAITNEAIQGGTGSGNRVHIATKLTEQGITANNTLDLVLNSAEGYSFYRGGGLKVKTITANNGDGDFNVADSVTIDANSDSEITALNVNAWTVASGTTTITNSKSSTALVKLNVKDRFYVINSSYNPVLLFSKVTAEINTTADSENSTYSTIDGIGKMNIDSTANVTMRGDELRLSGSNSSINIDGHFKYAGGTHSLGFSIYGGSLNVNNTGTFTLAEDKALTVRNNATAKININGGGKFIMESGSQIKINVGGIFVTYKDEEGNVLNPTTDEQRIILRDVNIDNNVKTWSSNFTQENATANATGVRLVGSSKFLNSSNWKIDRRLQVGGEADLSTLTISDSSIVDITSAIAQNKPTVELIGNAKLVLTKANAITQNTTGFVSFVSKGDLANTLEMSANQKYTEMSVEKTLSVYLLDNALLEIDGALTVAVGQELQIFNFAENSVKVGSADESTLNAIKLYDSNKELMGTATLVDGYLTLASVPEPAEWAMILGGIALGLAIYRRRK